MIGADGVRIDLGGHTLSGPGDGVGIDGNGGFDRFTIRNGTISGFLHGIDLVETDHGRIAQVVVTGNGRGINISRSIGMEVDRVVIDGNRFDGLSVAFSEQTSVRRSCDHPQRRQRHQRAGVARQHVRPRRRRRQRAPRHHGQPIRGADDRPHRGVGQRR